MLFLNAKNDASEERNGKEYPWGGNDFCLDIGIPRNMLMFKIQSQSNPI